MTEGIKSAIELTRANFGDIIVNDMKDYTDPFSFNTLQKMTLDDYYPKFTIKNNTLFIEKEGFEKTEKKVLDTFRHLKSILKHASKHGLKFPDVSFIYSMKTTGLSTVEARSNNIKIPIFVLCKAKKDGLGIRVPNMFHGNINLHDKRMALKRSIAKKINYKTRINKLYYRGGASGKGSIPRINLVSHFGKHKNFDVNIVTQPNPKNIPKSIIDTIEKPIGKHTPNILNVLYKHNIHMPGSADMGGYSYGLQELLHWGNTIVFWDETCYEWYYKKLLEDKLVTIATLDNIEDISNSLLEDEIRSEKIASNSMDFANLFLNKDVITSYWYLVFTEYAKLYKNKKKGYEVVPKLPVDSLNLFEYIQYIISNILLSLGLKKVFLKFTEMILYINNFSRNKKAKRKG